MAKGITLWHSGRKTKDYQFQDRIAKEHIERSGTSFNVHKYIGPYQQSPTDPTVSIPSDGNLPNELTVQDLTVLETRDRKYDTNIVDLHGCYIVQEPGFDLTQFGIMMSGDVILVEFHLNDHTERLGRKLMSGDVLEVVHLRDELPLDQNSAPIPKYYVVQDAIRPPAGYGPTWYAHTWKVKCTPITDTQEYMDILHNPAGQADTTLDWQDSIGSTSADGTGLGVPNNSGITPSTSGSASTLAADIQATQLVAQAATEAVRKRAFFIRHLYMRPANCNVRDGLIKWIMDDDALPPNWIGDFIQSGVTFPENPSPGDYFIRLDYEPVALFLRVENVWRRVQDAWRTEWTPASRILDGYLRNNNITIVDPSSTGSFPEKQPLADAVLPRADILPGTKEDDIKIT
jgi:hypothetical protein